MSESNRPRLLRRQLFAATGAMSALAAAASLLLPTTRDVAVAASAPDSSAGQRGGYSPTRHVLRYYQTTRI